jgi:hypothetical protein
MTNVMTIITSTKLCFQNKTKQKVRLVTPQRARVMLLTQ